ncbi:hypothetical protein MWU57_15945 [Isoptericola sp. S6320L]|uniref:hypothetical protein n=1 Tax=Isoptericola sp. S6320L TaxID=2926411 RepID=UPI001FF28794|nr:hypothetical protein [Isoptericola sp. S6320L]MCK0118521.1 hypothetical protein [Isoptericola sp. S6320L]
MKTVTKLWAAAWSPRNAVWAVPATAVLVVLALIATLQVGPLVSATWQRHREAKLLVWDPGPWALTVEDFPEGTTREVPVERAWVGSWSLEPRDEERLPDDVVPLPPRMPALRLLTSVGFQSAVRSGMAHGELRTSGVAAGRAQVFTSVVTAGRTPRGVETVTDIYRSRLLAESGPRGPFLPEPHEVDRLRAVGDDPGAVEDGLTLPWDEYGDRDPAAGVHGYAGFTAVEPGPGGADARRITAAMTVVDGALVLVGTSVPVEAEAPAGLEIPALLDRMAAKLRTDPPQSEGPHSVALPEPRHREDPRPLRSVRARGCARRSHRRRA